LGDLQVEVELAQLEIGVCNVGHQRHHDSSPCPLGREQCGVGRLSLASRYCADMAIDWPVSWVLGLESLTQEEKEAILWKNLEKLLGI
jgi:hypothetical protein